jgi:probable F420-dependent oxidoreductase
MDEEDAMRFGVVLPIWQLSIPEADSLARRAEELGFDGVFIPDHILAPSATRQHYGAMWPDPFATLAYLAGRTTRIQLGASVIVLPYRNPLVTAKAAATVDQVSGGRFVLGVGVGWDEEEFRYLGLPFSRRGEMSDEYIRIIKAAWGSDLPSFAGKYLTFSGAGFAPRPLQQPGPPIWVAASPGVLSAPSIRRVAALGDAWHPLALSLDDLEKGIAQVRAEAAKLGRREGPRFAPRNALGLTAARKGAGRGAFEGSPDEVAADIRRVQGLGADYVAFDLPRADVPTMIRTMARFASEVRPAVSTS